MGLSVETTSAHTIDNYFDPKASTPEFSEMQVTSASATELVVSSTVSGKTFTIEVTGEFPTLGPSAKLGDYMASSAMATSLKLTQSGSSTIYSTPQAVALKALINNLVNSSAAELQQLYSGDDQFVGSSNTNADGSNDHVFGYGGNDTYFGNTTSSGYADFFDGGSGIDTAVFRGTASSYIISNQTMNLEIDGTKIYSGPTRTVEDKQAGRDGIKQLANVERLQFSDKKIALDIDGNAGKVAKILVCVFGRVALNNKDYAGYAGIGLNLIDSGMTYESLSALAINAVGAKTREAVVDLLWTNLMGSHPTTAQAQPFIDFLTPDLSNLGHLGAMAADYAATIGVVNSNALGLTGLEYI